MLIQDNFEYLEARVGDEHKYLSQINTKKASGPDGVNPSLLKEGTNQLATVFCILFNLTLSIGEFSRTWKLANIISLYKKNNRTSVSNKDWFSTHYLTLLGKGLSSQFSN